MEKNKLQIDYDLKEFIAGIMNEKHPGKHPEKESYNEEYMKDYLNEALKFYNIDKRFLKLDYNSKNAEFNIQYEIAQLLSFGLSNYKKSFLSDNRKNKMKLTIEDIINYNLKLINKVEEKDKLPEYVRILFRNNRTYSYNKNFGDLSRMLVERLTHLFYLTYNVECDDTEKILIDLIEEIDSWNSKISRRIHNKNSESDNSKNAETVNKENKSDESITYDKYLKDITKNVHHSLDTNITMIFKSLIREDVKKSNLFLTEEFINYMKGSNGTSKDPVLDESINKEINKIFNSDNIIKESREQYQDIIDKVIKEEIKRYNYFDNKGNYENKLTKRHIEIIKLFSEADYAKKNKSKMTEFIGSELIQYVGQYVDQTLPISFSTGYGKIISDYVGISKYYDLIDEFIFDYAYKRELGEEPFDYNSPLLSDYLNNNNNYYRLLISIDPLILKLSDEISEEVINSVIPNLNFITDRVTYDNFKKDINLFLGQIYLQVIEKEHFDYVQLKKNQILKSTTKVKKSNKKKKPNKEQITK